MDIDGDGDYDIVAANANDDKIVWYENNYPTNSFSGRVVTTTAHGVWAVYALDLDRDGDNDIVAAEKDDDTIAWYENDGGSNPSFSAHTISNSFDHPISIYALDINKDGDNDVIAAFDADDKIVLFENDGNQSFTANLIATTADY